MEVINGVLYHAVEPPVQRFVILLRKKLKDGAGKLTGWPRHLFAGWYYPLLLPGLQFRILHPF